jgi:hypothetical protein
VKIAQAGGLPTFQDSAGAQKAMGKQRHMSPLQETAELRECAPARSWRGHGSADN